MMQKILFLAPFCFFSSLLAFYVGNPANPAIMSSGFFSRAYLVKGTSGYLYDYTTVKRYHASKSKANFNPNATFKQFGIHSQMGSLSLILLDRLELFGYLGGSKEQTQGKPHPSNLFDFESNYQFSWATGARAVLLQYGTLYLGSDFTYFAIPESTKSYFRYFNRIGLPIEYGTKQETSLQEWQISGSLSSRFGFFTPYVGGTYLYSTLKVASSQLTGPIEYENNSKWGVFFGLTISVTGKFHIDLERRTQNESGYSAATTVVF